MRILKTIWAMISARWFLSLLGVVILALLIWFVGDLLSLGAWQPFGTDIAKLIAILVIVFLWGISNLYAQRRARKANDQALEDLAKPVDIDDPASDEIQELDLRFQEALARLQKQRFNQAGSRGRQYLYELPWYIIIGPPGSGKSTLLENSGLDFPLGADQGDYEYRGIGGTRNCDWFFTDEAVLIDTAGRYTTQDSRQEIDSAAWQGFLDLLKKHRPRQPINGVLIAISVDELVGSGDRDVVRHARTIRSRLIELSEQLGIQIPTYVILTKADLIAGFVEFFGDMDEEERQQVWGVTFPYADDRGAKQRSTPASFSADFDRLIDRLHDRINQQMQRTRRDAARVAIYKFPAQIAALKPDLERFMAAAFGGRDEGGAVRLRGVYLSSGLQQGLPIDRMMNAVASSFGLAPSTPSTAEGERSYFLTRLLHDVIFAEASLVGANTKEERRRRLLLAGGYAVLFLSTIGLLAGWITSYLGNRDRILTAEQELLYYSKDVAGVPHTQLAGLDRDLAPILPLLDQLRDLPAGYRERESGDPLNQRFGLSQSAMLNDYGELAYQKALERLFLPRLLLAEEQDLQASIVDASYVLPALKVYLMLGGQTEPDDALIRQWLTEGWRQQYPTADAGRQALEEHLDALLTMDIRERPSLDGNLITQARQTLTEISVARRAYDDFRQSASAQQLPFWRVVDHAGPDARRVFVRQSGRDVNADLPGLFTHDVFHGSVLPSLPDIAKAAAAESWVLGVEDSIEVSEAELQQLEIDILRLYEDDYIRVWDDLLKDVTLAPLTDLSGSVEALNTLSGPNSPLKLLMQAIVSETRLTVPPEEPEEEGEGGQGGDKLAKKAIGKALGKYGAIAKKAVRLIPRPGGSEAGPALIPGQAVEDHFAFLKDLVEGVDGAPPLLDQPMALLGRTLDSLKELQFNPNADEVLVRLELQRIAAQLISEAERMPEPFNTWLGGVAETIAGDSTSAIRQELNARWRADVLPFCQTALQNRFPFSPSSSVDVSADDFSRLFGPGGLIQSFFQNHLQQFVDTAGDPWRWRSDLGISNRVLTLFQRADKIRASMFGAGSEPSVQFTLRPVELSAQTLSATLDIGGQKIKYAHGPPETTSLRWPVPGGQLAVRLTLAPQGSFNNQTFEANGAWAWLRLLHQAKFDLKTPPDLFTVRFSKDGHAIVYDLHAGSVYNPFDLRAFANFRCVGQL